VQIAYSPQSQLSLNKVNSVKDGEELKSLTIHPLAFIPYTLNDKVNSLNS